MKTTLLSTLFCAVCFFGLASNKQTKEITEAPRWGAGLKLSTNGIGIDVIHEFLGKNKLFARFSGTYLAYPVQMPFDFSGQKLDLDIQPTLGSAGVNVVYQMNSEYSTIGITAGLSYMFTKLDVVGVFQEDQLAGEQVVPKEDMGQMGTTLTTNKVAPYFGIILGKVIPKKRVGLALEIGTFYQGKPNVDLNFTKLMSPSNDQQEVMQNNMSEYVWLPQLSINITFKIK